MAAGRGGMTAREVTKGAAAEGPGGQHVDLGFYSASDEKSLESFGAET